MLKKQDINSFLEKIQPHLHGKIQIVIFGGAAAVLHDLREETKDIDVLIENADQKLKDTLRQIAKKEDIDLCLDIFDDPKRDTLIQISANISTLDEFQLLATKVMLHRHPAYTNDAQDVLNIMIKHRLTMDDTITICKQYFSKIKPASESWLEMITSSKRYIDNINLH